MAYIGTHTQNQIARFRAMSADECRATWKRWRREFEAARRAVGAKSADFRAEVESCVKQYRDLGLEIDRAVWMCAARDAHIGALEEENEAQSCRLDWVFFGRDGF